MSWLNLNQSFSNIKGQITSFANEVLSEGIVEDTDPFTELSAANNKIKELQNLCASQDVEIKTLRRQNADYQQEKINAATTKIHKNGEVGTSKSEEDDSSATWFWDPPDESPDPKPKLKPEDDENQKLRGMVAALEKEVSNLKAKHNQTNDSIADDSQISVLKEQVRMLKEENKGLTSSLDELDSQNQMAMEKLIRIKKELEINHDELSKEHESLKMENKQLKASVDEANELKSNNEKLYEDLKTMRHKFDNLEKVHRLLEENAEKFQEENQDLSEENFKLQEDCARLQHDLEEINMKNIVKVGRNSEDYVSNDKYRELEERFMILEKKNAESLSSKSSEVNQALLDSHAQEIIEKLKFEIVELQNKLNTNEEIKRLNLEIDHLNKEILALNDKVGDKVDCDEFRKLFDKHINFDLPGINKQMKLKSADIITNTDIMFKTLAEYKSKNDTLEIRVSENSREINNMQVSIDEMNAEIDILTSDLAHYEHENSELKKNNDFLIAELGALKSSSKLEPILEQNEDNMVKLQTELEDCSNLNKSFEAELEKNEAELKGLEVERDHIKKELEFVKSELSGYKKQLNEAKSNLDDSNESNDPADSLKQLSKVQSEYEKIKTQLLAVTADHEKSKIDLSIIDNEKVLLMREVSELKAELQTKAIIEDYARKVEAEKSELENKLMCLSELEASIEVLNRDNEILKNTVSNLEYTKEEAGLMANNESSEIAAQLENLCQKNQLLEQELMSKKQELNEVRCELNLKIENYKTQLNECNLSVENITMKHRDVLKAQEDVLKQNESLLLRNEEFEQEILKIDSKMNTLNENNSDLENQCAQKDSELVNKIQEIVEMKNSLLSKEAEINEKNTLIEKLKEENSKQTIEEVDKSNAVNQDEFDEVRRKLDEVCADKLALKTEKQLECDTLKNEVNEMKLKLGEMEQSKTALEALKVETESQLEQLSSERNELINLVTQKHNESLGYHGEIQRLNGVLMSENERYRELERIYKEEKDNQNRIAESEKVCSDCEEFRRTLRSSEERCGSLAKRVEEMEKNGVNAEMLEKIAEKNKFLVEKCEVLSQNLLTEQANCKQIQQEKSEILEKEQLLSRELERLRLHLLEVEEAHTQELMLAEQRSQQALSQLASAQQQAKHSSTLYTSSSIRANQEVETLRTQIGLVEKQRDEIQARLDQSEDTNNKHLAALTNLQCVLEQFQMDKERSSSQVVGRARIELEQAHAEVSRLQGVCEELRGELREAAGGLRAADRLTQQLETRGRQLQEVKEQAFKLESEVAQWQRKYNDAVSNQQDKVDKSLVKNLIIGFIQTESGQRPGDRAQVLRILSSVLDFDQAECSRAGLGGPSASSTGGRDSLAQEFIKFLEKESRPREGGEAANLPTLLQLTPPRKTSGLGPPPTAALVQTTKPESPMSQKNISPQLIVRKSPSSSPRPIDNPILAAASSTATPVSVGSSPGFSIFTPIANPDIGVNVARNSESSILKNVLKDA